MLTFETPFYEIENVVIFRDHAVPTLFHYLAGPPRLTRDEDGKPHLLLLKYRHALDSSSSMSAVERDQLGGGFLLFGVDCGIADDTKQKIKRELQSRMPPGSGPISLVPVLYTEGTVKVLALDAQSGAESTPEGSRFIRKVLGTATPSLMQDQRAIFSLALTPGAATLLEEAYESELSPIGVMYELEFSGLRPALSVKVRADLKRVYDGFEAKLNVGVEADGVEVGVDIGATLSWLKEQGAIEVEIIRQQEGSDVNEMERQAMTLLKETLLKELFKPRMSQQQVPSLEDAMDQVGDMVASSERMNEGQSSGGKVKVGLELAYKHEEELKTVTYDYDVAAPETRTHAPNGFFSALLTGSEKAKHIREINLDDQFFKTMTVQAQTAADFEGLDLETALLHIQYGGTEDDPRESWTATFSATDAEPKTFQAFRDDDDFSYRYQLEYFFGGSEEVASLDNHQKTPWRVSTSRAQVVHPASDVEMLSVWVEPGVVDWATVDQIETTLTYEHEASDFKDERTMVIREDSERERWLVRLPPEAPRAYTVKNRWHLKNGSEVDGEPTTSENRHLYVGDPFPHRLAVTIVPQVDPTQVQRVLVHLEYDDEDNDLVVRKAVEIIGPQFATQTVDIPIIDPERREYSYAISLVPAAGGEAVNRPRVTTDEELIAVLPAGRRFDVRVIVLGNLASAGLLGLQVDLRCDPPDGVIQETHSQLLEPGGETRFTHSMIVREDQAASFEYKLTAILESGDMEEGRWTRWDRSLLPIPAATVLDEL
ncbi:MAG: hypothetical protein AAF799_08305 [Myxococcota bacterium]